MKTFVIRYYHTGKAKVFCARLKMIRVNKEQ